MINKWADKKIGLQVGVVIGRFEPPHNGHLRIFEEAIKDLNNDKIIIFIGSAFKAPTFKNPFSGSDRSYLIRTVIEDLCIKYNRLYSSVHIHLLSDFYSDNHWQKSISFVVNEIMNHEQYSVKLYGHLKDNSSNYLLWFPSWKFEDVFVNDKELVINATDIRNASFKKDWEFIKPLVPVKVYEWLQHWVESDEYIRLLEEYDNNQKLKQQYSNLKYEPVFVTTDAIIISNNSVLLMKRKSHPGKGLYSLIGGFLNPQKTILSSCVETVLLKTGIELNTQYVKTEVVDTVDRSLRGRTITHVFLFKQKIDSSKLQKNCLLIPIHELYLLKEHMFEDHYLILEQML